MSHRDFKRAKEKRHFHLALCFNKDVAEISERTENFSLFFSHDETLKLSVLDKVNFRLKATAPARFVPLRVIHCSKKLEIAAGVRVPLKAHNDNYNRRV